jgi:hypothetical protein
MRRAVYVTGMARRRSTASRRARTWIWWVLGVLIAVEAAHELGGPGPGALFEDWIHDVVLACAAGLCLARAFALGDARAAWTAIGVGLACWALAGAVWSVGYSGDSRPPYPSAADVGWLLWYPFTAYGIWLLARRRALSFELHRWLDGIAVALIIMTAGVALFVQPIVAENRESAPAAVVTFAYPVLDLLLIGAVLGLFGLLGWRPGRAWLVLGAGCVVLAGADAVYAVQFGDRLPLDRDYDFVWTLAAVLIAAAAYGPPARVLEDEPLVGWRAIVLPLIAQGLAASIQIYGLFFGELGRSERIVTLVLLLIASVQIIIARPRARDVERAAVAADPGAHADDGGPGTSPSNAGRADAGALPNPDPYSRSAQRGHV